jgi:tRNA pseudouridine55 synthase
VKDFGLLIVDKPVGPTSHFVVHTVRQGTGIRKVGHAGTLDPRASGVLVLCLGAATRLSEFLSTSDKQYLAVVRFGLSTRTYDGGGDIVSHSGRAPDRSAIEAALPRFLGEIEQVPPPYSAIKVAGQKAYELARRGEEVDLGPRRVTIRDLRLLRYDPPDLELEIECSAGTYIRSLAHDLGEQLGSGAHLAALRRTRAGPFGVEQAVPLSRLQESFAGRGWEKFLLPPTAALPGLPQVAVSEGMVERLRNGMAIPASGVAAGKAAAIGPGGNLVAILEGVPQRAEWHPRKVFLA